MDASHSSAEYEVIATCSHDKMTEKQKKSPLSFELKDRFYHGIDRGKAHILFWVGVGCYFIQNVIR